MVSLIINFFIVAIIVFITISVFRAFIIALTKTPVLVSGFFEKNKKNKFSLWRDNKGISQDFSKIFPYIYYKNENNKSKAVFKRNLMYLLFLSFVVLGYISYIIFSNERPIKIIIVSIISIVSIINVFLAYTFKSINYEILSKSFKIFWFVVNLLILGYLSLQYGDRIANSANKLVEVLSGKKEFVIDLNNLDEKTKRIDYNVFVMDYSKSFGFKSKDVENKVIELMKNVGKQNVTNLVVGETTIPFLWKKNLDANEFYDEISRQISSPEIKICKHQKNTNNYQKFRGKTNLISAFECINYLVENILKESKKNYYFNIHFFSDLIHDFSDNKINNSQEEIARQKNKIKELIDYLRSISNNINFYGYSDFIDADFDNKNLRFSIKEIISEFLKTNRDVDLIFSEAFFQEPVKIYYINPNDIKTKKVLINGGDSAFAAYGFRKDVNFNKEFRSLVIDIVADENPRINFKEPYQLVKMLSVNENLEIKTHSANYYHKYSLNKIGIDNLYYLFKVINDKNESIAVHLPVDFYKVLEKSFILILGLFLFSNVILMIKYGIINLEKTD